MRNIELKACEDRPVIQITAKYFFSEYSTGVIRVEEVEDNRKRFNTKKLLDISDYENASTG